MVMVTEARRVPIAEQGGRFEGIDGDDAIEFLPNHDRGRGADREVNGAAGIEKDLEEAYAVRRPAGPRHRDHQILGRRQRGPHFTGSAGEIFNRASYRWRLISPFFKSTVMDWKYWFTFGNAELNRTAP